jgi:hypothetical protein
MRIVPAHGGGAIAVLLLAACAITPQGAAVPPPAAAPPLDASYDWHGLLLLPFGSVLKDVPFTLHEVLMFRDAAHAAQVDDAECYAIEQTAPRFLARTPSEYLLCFRHDHLARVEATVSVPQQEAARIFADACALWQKNAGVGQPGAGQPGAGLPDAAPPEPPAAAAAQVSACDGRDGAVAYSGRLEESIELADRALDMRLEALTQP